MEIKLPDSFHLIKQIGAGGSGTVYLVQCKGNKMAFKVIKLTSDAKKENVKREIAIMKYLSSYPKCQEYIICYYKDYKNVGRFEDHIIIVMEYFESINLLHAKIRDKIKVIKELTKCIKYLHQVGIVHRDIKPGNILISPDEKVKLIDFGFACATKTLTGIDTCKAYAKIGTLSYMAPEIWLQTMKTKEVAKTDIYSLGVVFFFIIAGKKPFESKNEKELKRLVTTVAPPPPNSGNSVLDVLISSMLHKDPSKRPSITDVDNILELVPDTK